MDLKIILPILFFVVTLQVDFLNGDEHTHIYKNEEEIVLWMNTVGPYHNQQETYKYYSLPYCKGLQESIGHPHETLGEALEGYELEYSQIGFNFKGM